MDFQGAGVALSDSGLAQVQANLEVGAAEIWTVLTVETGSCGFFADRRPSILYEQHIFHRQTNGHFDAVAGDISNPNPGNYGPSGSHQYDRLLRAVALDRKAALSSASWGIGQVMGFNFQIAGYADVDSMINAMMESEDKQLLAMASMIEHNKIDAPLRAHDWTSFARVYNGPNFAINQYDKRLAAAYQKSSLGLLPDLNVRSVQLYLTYLGFAPGTIDGVPGRLTMSALSQFQQQKGLPLSDQITADTLACVKAAALPGDPDVPPPRPNI